MRRDVSLGRMIRRIKMGILQNCPGSKWAKPWPCASQQCVTLWAVCWSRWLWTFQDSCGACTQVAANSMLGGQYHRHCIDLNAFRSKAFEKCACGQHNKIEDQRCKILRRKSEIGARESALWCGEMPLKRWLTESKSSTQLRWTIK
jgi:hypothetical protein